jgi:hypothetical protein
LATQPQISNKKPSRVDFGVFEFMFRTTENNLPQLDNAPEENENANPELGESNWKDWISNLSQSELPFDSIPENSDSHVLTERQSRVYSRRKL